jgi:hypothetical protein
MKFSLNVDKSPFYSVGPFLFTIGQEEHNIDVNQVSDEYKKQLLYGVNMGTLLSSDEKGLAALSSAMQPTTPIPQEQVPIKYQEVSKLVQTVVKDPIREDLKPLRTLLRKTVATIKKESAEYNPSRLRKMLNLEEDQKKRKSVIQFLEERLDQHARSVAAMIPGEDQGTVHQNDSLARSTQITNIVESEEVQITFGEDDLQDDNEGGLLLSSEVLCKLDEE